jgi:hypothetical protein
VADIVYRSDAIKMHIDLLAGARGSKRPVASAKIAAARRSHSSRLRN